MGSGLLPVNSKRFPWLRSTARRCGGARNPTLWRSFILRLRCPALIFHFPTLSNTIFSCIKKKADANYVLSKSSPLNALVSGSVSQIWMKLQSDAAEGAPTTATLLTDCLTRLCVLRVFAELPHWSCSHYEIHQTARPTVLHLTRLAERIFLGSLVLHICLPSRGFYARRATVKYAEGLNVTLLSRSNPAFDRNRGIENERPIIHVKGCIPHCRRIARQCFKTFLPPYLSYNHKRKEKSSVLHSTFYLDEVIFSLCAKSKEEFVCQLFVDSFSNMYFDCLNFASTHFSWIKMKQ